MNTTSFRMPAVALVIVLFSAGCGYKGDLVAPEHRDEKAGQVEPDPVEPAAGAPIDAERESPHANPPGTSPPG